MSDKAKGRIGIIDGYNPKRGIIRAEAATVQQNWGIALLGIPTAWQRTQGEGVKIMLCDTGVDANHPDLKENVKYGFNATVSPHTDNFNDLDGHGTHCAGIIAANGQVSGVAPKADLFVTKILGDNGSGQTMWMADAIQYARRVGADIVSMSLGTHTEPESEVLEAFKAADREGIVFVLAAGNERKEYVGDSVGWPAKYVTEIPNLIVVSAIDANMGSPNWSSRGSEVTIAGPGKDIFSTFPGGKYQSMSGTSMATPFIAGAIALMIAHHRRNPDIKVGALTAKDIKNLIIQHAKHTNGVLGRTDEYGFGVFDVSAIHAATIQE